MKPRIYYTESQKALMWERWKQGDSLYRFDTLDTLDRLYPLYRLNGATMGFCAEEYTTTFLIPNPTILKPADMLPAKCVHRVARQIGDRCTRKKVDVFITFCVSNRFTSFAVEVNSHSLSVVSRIAF